MNKLKSLSQESRELQRYAWRRFGKKTHTKVPGGGGGDSHMEQTGMLVGNFEFNP